MVHAACCMLHVACVVRMHGARCMLHVACCMCSTHAWCTLHVACCMLYMLVRIRARTHASKYTHARARARIQIHARTHAQPPAARTHLCTHARTHAHSGVVPHAAWLECDDRRAAARRSCRASFHPGGVLHAYHASRCMLHRGSSRRSGCAFIQSKATGAIGAPPECARACQAAMYAVEWGCQ